MRQAPTGDVTDRIIDHAGSMALGDAARAGGAPDVELLLYEGVYHEAHNDLDREVFLRDVVAWLARHLPVHA